MKNRFQVTIHSELPVTYTNKSFIAKTFRFFEIALENLEIHYICDCDVIDRAGQLHANISRVRTKAKLEDYSFKFESDSVIPLVSETVNQLVNSHWRIIHEEMKTHFESALSIIGHAIITSIFNEIPIQSLVHCKNIAE